MGTGSLRSIPVYGIDEYDIPYKRLQKLPMWQLHIYIHSDETAYAYQNNLCMILRPVQQATAAFCYCATHRAARVLVSNNAFTII